ncbi:MAG: 2,5-diamino-6-(ribosylamino)-4(3H)-pyrimidinone 5'-phosphate reductase [Methanobacteriota archaeon]|nr:MAG: 2,5-diamino-6-(ribosylamino)-4(3H)-pyrimidinone 5'-phosphate reductase [Euryarchaeota archaeon]
MRPHVTVNAAMSVDGKIALPSRTGVRISHDEDLRRVHELRASCDAILVGVGTILMDDPKLTVKKEYAKGRNPLRVVLDSDGSCPENAAVLDGSAPTLIATNVNCTKTFPNADVIRCGDDQVDVPKLLEILHEQGVQRLLVEGGSTANWTFLSGGLVDELLVFTASMIIGGHSTPTLVAGEGIKRLEDAIRLRLQRASPVGDGILLEYTVVRE